MQEIWKDFIALRYDFAITFGCQSSKFEVQICILDLRAWTSYFKYKLGRFLSHGGEAMQAKSYQKYKRAHELQGQIHNGI